MPLCAPVTPVTMFGGELVDDTSAIAVASAATVIGEAAFERQFAGSLLVPSSVADEVRCCGSPRHCHRHRGRRLIGPRARCTGREQTADATAAEGAAVAFGTGYNFPNEDAADAAAADMDLGGESVRETLQTDSSEIPDLVQKFILFFHQRVRDLDTDEIHSLYESRSVRALACAWLRNGNGGWSPRLAYSPMPAFASSLGGVASTC